MVTYILRVLGSNTVSRHRSGCGAAGVPLHHIPDKRGQNWQLMRPSCMDSRTPPVVIAKAAIPDLALLHAYLPAGAVCSQSKARLPDDSFSSMHILPCEAAVLSRYLLRSQPVHTCTPEWLGRHNRPCGLNTTIPRPPCCFSLLGHLHGTYFPDLRCPFLTSLQLFRDVDSTHSQ